MFAVKVDEDQSVRDLKEAIKKVKFNTIKCEAHKLQLFLAKTDRAWLQSSSDDVKELQKGKKSDEIQVLAHEDKELQSEKCLAEVLAGMDDPLEDQIHVLVMLPAQVEDILRSFAKFRKSRARQMRVEMQLEQLLASLPHNRSMIQYTAAKLGEVETKRLEKLDMIIDMEPVKSRETFWSKEFQIQADAITNNAVFDAFITLFIDNIMRRWFGIRQWCETLFCNPPWNVSRCFDAR